MKTKVPPKSESRTIILKQRDKTIYKTIYKTSLHLVKSPNTFKIGFAVQQEREGGSTMIYAWMAPAQVKSIKKWLAALG